MAVRRHSQEAIGGIGLLVLLCGGAQAADPDWQVRFNRDIRPILSENCFFCHGPDSAHRKAGLRLDQKDGLFGKREHGLAVVANKPSEGLLFPRVISTDPDEVMPPPDTHKSLSAAQKETLRRWIDQGAAWEPQWSLVAPFRPELPEIKHANWARNPIDRFILARLEAEGLEPAPEADRRTLIRRVTFDLTGLPPTAVEVEEFVNDPSADAYEKVVDRLLASVHYGEHRAKYWLDAARYGDTHGIHIDNYREIWPYRDWVIGAFNRNLPFDRFTVDQIAGDLLPGHTLEQQIASGFNRCNITTSEGGSIPEEVEAMYAKDRVETTSTVWLGLTLQCATCHDHKFDPISQKEFYEFSAYFRNTLQRPMDGNVPDTPPVIVVPSPEDRPRWDALSTQADGLTAQRAAEKKQAAKAFAKWSEGGEPRQLTEPVDPTGEMLVAALDEGNGNEVTVQRNGKPQTMAAPAGSNWLAGPLKEDKALKALKFDQKSIDIPDVGDFDADQPFSVGGWVFIPPEDGTFSFVSKVDASGTAKKAKKGEPGWNLVIAERVPQFDIVDEKGKKLEVKSNSSTRPQAGKWVHIFATYDGSRDERGLNIYINGKIQYGDYVKEPNGALDGSIRNTAALRIGGDGTRTLAGGAAMDVRVYQRELLDEEVAVLARWDALRDSMAHEDRKLSAAESNDLQQLYLNRFDAGYRQTSQNLAKVEAGRREIRRRSPVTLVMQEKPGSSPEAHVLFRGQYDQPRDQVAPATPAALHPMPANAPANRLGLAEWLIDPANPLTARVTVNRYWQEVFGQGLVRTSEDFGIMGENPSHPELLDWLAVDFRDPSTGSTSSPLASSGQAWDIKRFFKQLVMSATYRQSAIVSADKLAKDPGNRLLSRGPRFRMDAEMLRDFALAGSGLLVDEVGGPSVKPYQPPGVWEAVAMNGSNTGKYAQDSGANLYRRSMYTFWKRSAPPASMEIFNAPSRETCTVRRERTDTPLQALVTMNDPQWVEAARNLAELALTKAPDDFDKRLDYVSSRLLARPFEPHERDICRASLEAFMEKYGNDTDGAKKLIHTGASKPNEQLAASDLAAWTMLTSQVMNLDEALNK